LATAFPHDANRRVTRPDGNAARSAAAADHRTVIKNAFTGTVDRCQFRRRQIMTNKAVKIPGPDHPISIDANPSRVVVKVGHKVIADTRDALTLREASYPAVQYIPRRDVDMAALTRSEHTTFCPYKGDASYYSIPAGGDRSLNAVWTYETPFEAMAQIKDYVAFYPDRVDEIS
jgi:uncharacterized protein (DUF427 family)